jgi:von Willebrand factor type C domain
MNGEYYPSAKDKSVRPDECSVCSCHNETSVCRKTTCPVLDCLPDYQITRQGDCCAHCVTEKTEYASTTCTYKGVTYQVINNIFFLTFY